MISERLLGVEAGKDSVNASLALVEDEAKKLFKQEFPNAVNNVAGFTL